MGNLYQTVQGWLTRPFTTPLDAVQIFLLVGLLIIAFIFWGRVLAHLSEVV
jgi:hypothetical protein